MGGRCCGSGAGGQPDGDLSGPVGDDRDTLRPSSLAGVDCTDLILAGWDGDLVGATPIRSAGPAVQAFDHHDRGDRTARPIDDPGREPTENGFLLCCDGRVAGEDGQ